MNNLAPLAIAAGLGVVGVVVGNLAFASPDLKPGANAPTFSAKTTAGKTFDLTAERKRKPVFVYFISTSCPVSKEATPQYAKYAKAYAAQGIKVVGVVNSDSAGVRAWNRDHNVAYPVIPDPSYKIIKAYGVTQAPSAALIGKDGKVVKSWTGYSRAILTETVAASAKALGKAPLKLDFSGAPAQWSAG